MKTTFQEGLTKALQIATKIESRMPLTREEERWLRAERRRHAAESKRFEQKLERDFTRDEVYKKQVRNLSVGAY